jgi:hypothetical protein
VKEVSLSLTKESDGSAHVLEWTAFKSPQIKIGDPTAITVELLQALTSEWISHYAILSFSVTSRF